MSYGCFNMLFVVLVRNVDIVALLSPVSPFCESLSALQGSIETKPFLRFPECHTVQTLDLVHSRTNCINSSFQTIF